MNFVKEQLIRLDTDILVKLHNMAISYTSNSEGGSKVESRQIHIFNQESLNNLFPTPWEFFKQLQLIGIHELAEGDYFMMKNPTSLEPIPTVVITNPHRSPVDFKAIEKMLSESNTLPKTYGIHMTQYEEYDINEFINQWLEILSDSEKEEIAQTILNHLKREGVIKGDTVFVEVEYDFG